MPTASQAGSLFHLATALLGVLCCPLSQKSLCPPAHLTAGSMLDLSSVLGLAHTVAWNSLY